MFFWNFWAAKRGFKWILRSRSEDPDHSRRNDNSTALSGSFARCALHRNLRGLEPTGVAATTERQPSSLQAFDTHDIAEHEEGREDAKRDKGLKRFVPQQHASKHRGRRQRQDHQCRQRVGDSASIPSDQRDLQGAHHKLMVMQPVRHIRRSTSATSAVDGKERVCDGPKENQQHSPGRQVRQPDQQGYREPSQKMAQRIGPHIPQKNPAQGKVEHHEAHQRRDNIQLRKIEAEEKSINDAIDRLSIGPLYRAGEFTTIAEGETEVDAAIMNGTWVEKMREGLDRLPEKAGTIGRYAAITKDTALFKGLARSVQYGDFIAKSILYDHLTKRQGKSHDEAMKTVIDEFVAYNFLPSRSRSYLESIGLTWFWAFKLRSIKVAQRMLRDHPLRALLAGAGGSLVADIPGVNVGSPLSDNAASVILDGRAGYDSFDPVKNGPCE